MPILSAVRFQPLPNVVTTANWGDFWLFLGLGFACLLVSALLARVRIGSLPANPLHWHHWVITRARVEPTIEPPPGIRIYRPYLLFWAASLCCLGAALLELIALLYVLAVSR